MLHRYAFSNFQSFRERAEVSWLLDRKVPEAVWSHSAASGERLSTVMAVIGSNASGKTALIKSIFFLHWFVKQSFAADPEADLPCLPHAAALNEPSEFEMDTDVNGRLMRYTLRCTPKRVLREALYARHERMRYVFVREWNESTQAYDIKQQDFGFAPSEARKVRPNASLISTAAQYGLDLASQFVSGVVASNINRRGRIASDSTTLQRAAGQFAQR